MPSRTQSLCYVLRSFPEPSETFIAEEAISVIGRGIKVSIVVMTEGNRSVVHPASQRLIDEGYVCYVGRPDRAAVLRGLLSLMVRQPWTTLAGLAKALRSPQRWMYFNVLPAAAWCLSRRVEYFHAHFADFNLQAAQALSVLIGRSFGVTTHRYDITDDPIEVGVARNLFNECNLMITISQWNVSHMADKYQLSPNLLNIVHCGIDLDAFAFHRRSFADAEPLRLLNVGRLMPVKGHATLLRAMALVRDRAIPCRLEIIGGGPLEQDLLRLRDDLNLQGLVELRGPQTQQVVRESLRRAHAFVLSSISEGLPVACIEAAASGTPLIATRINGLPELIDDMVSGLLVEPDDPEALASAVIWAATHRDALPDIAAAARRKVEAEFDRPQCTAQLLALVDRATGRRP